MRLLLPALFLMSLTATACAGSTREESAVTDDALITGDVDSTFGKGGVVTLDAFPKLLFRSIAEQQDGSLVLAGYENELDVLKVIRLVRVRKDGSLDPSFGVGGVATVTGPTNTYLDRIETLPDDRILLVGSSYVARLTAAGELDASFGNGGIVDTTTVKVGKVAAWNIYEAKRHGDSLFLLLWGGLKVGAKPWYGFARLDANGAIDTSYGDGGVAQITAPAAGSHTSKFLVDDNGRVLTSEVPPDAWPLDANKLNLTPILRFDASGKPDATFGPSGMIWVDTKGRWQIDLKTLQKGLLFGESLGDGTVLFKLDGTVVTLSDHRAMARPQALEWQPDGSCLYASPRGTDSLFVSRILPNGGAADKSFAHNGEAFAKLPTPLYEVSRVHALRSGDGVVVLARGGTPLDDAPGRSYVVRFK